MDRYIQRVLKNWASGQNPPNNGRARLLLVASSHAYPLEHPDQVFHIKNLPTSAHLAEVHLAQSFKLYDLTWGFQLQIPAMRML